MSVYAIVFASTNDVILAPIPDELLVTGGASSSSSSSSSSGAGSTFGTAGALRDAVVRDYTDPIYPTTRLLPSSVRLFKLLNNLSASDARLSPEVFARLPRISKLPGGRLTFSSDDIARSLRCIAVTDWRSPLAALLPDLPARLNWDPAATSSVSLIVIVDPVGPQTVMMDASGVAGSASQASSSLSAANGPVGLPSYHDVAGAGRQSDDSDKKKRLHSIVKFPIPPIAGEEKLDFSSSKGARPEKVEFDSYKSPAGFADSFSPAAPLQPTPPSANPTPPPQRSNFYAIASHDPKYEASTWGFGAYKPLPSSPPGWQGTDPTSKRRKLIIFTAITVLIAICLALTLALGLYFGLRQSNNGTNSSGTTAAAPSASETANAAATTQLLYQPFQLQTTDSQLGKMCLAFSVAAATASATHMTDCAAAASASTDAPSSSLKVVQTLQAIRALAVGECVATAGTVLFTNSVTSAKGLMLSTIDCGSSYDATTNSTLIQPTFVLWSDLRLVVTLPSSGLCLSAVNITNKNYIDSFFMPCISPYPAHQMWNLIP
ncbi:hypothetical protein DFJ73DRAFT_792580 [Zopfochytrium polystomum]|nr:hypothetical protein DFJ73DRAFT_792580 [Zopfochytrium polystomum]